MIVGYVTNWLGLWMIFEPVEPRKIGPFKIHALFVRRQPEIAEVYAKIIADDIVTLGNIGEELLEGRRADRTRQMIETSLEPAIDKAVGITRSAVRVAVGADAYDSIRESVATEAADFTMTPLADDEFNLRQSARVREIITDRMRTMGHQDFSEMLRSGMREDEWLLLLHGAVLGFGAGVLHLLIFGA